jgi:hypothetical protein
MENEKNNQDFFLCYAIGRQGIAHAWGKGKTQEEAQSQCELAVRESNKFRHAPYAFVIGHNDWWSLNKNWKNLIES